MVSDLRMHLQNTYGKLCKYTKKIESKLLVLEYKDYIIMTVNVSEKEKINVNNFILK